MSSSNRKIAIEVVDRLSRLEVIFWLTVPVLAAWKAIDIILWLLR